MGLFLIWVAAVAIVLLRAREQTHVAEAPAAEAVT
jgi:hypothetical protein